MLDRARGSCQNDFMTQKNREALFDLLTLSIYADAHVSLTEERLVESAGIELRPHGKDRVGRCPFHDDQHPSLSVNLDTGAFRCRVPACGVHGRDVLAFHMQRHGLGFIDACKALNAWEGQP